MNKYVLSVSWPWTAVVMLKTLVFRGIARQESPHTLMLMSQQVG